MKIIKVEVIKKTFGKYKKGDVIEMQEATADACIKQTDPFVKVFKEKAKTK